jgi:hypothetical protein
MGDVPEEVATLIYHLLPGFVAAWIFYGLTAHPKADHFERVVQALIFTVIARGITIVVRHTLLLLGHYRVLGTPGHTHG